MPPARLRLPRSGFTAPRGAVRVSSPHLSLVSFPALPRKAGVAIVVSKKVAALAVARHLLKRRLFPVMRRHASAGTAFVLQVRAGAAKLPAPELRAELEGLYGRLIRQ